MATDPCRFVDVSYLGGENFERRQEALLSLVLQWLFDHSEEVATNQWTVSVCFEPSICLRTVLFRKFSLLDLHHFTADSTVSSTLHKGKGDNDMTWAEPFQYHSVVQLLKGSITSWLYIISHQNYNNFRHKNWYFYMWDVFCHVLNGHV